MADIAKLKTKAAGKGSPPAPEMTNGNLKKPCAKFPLKKQRSSFPYRNIFLTNLLKKPDNVSDLKKELSQTCLLPCGKNTKAGKAANLLTC